MANYKHGTIGGFITAGGICGWNNTKGNIIENCYNKGKIENNGCGYELGYDKCGIVGGIVGTNENKIKNCYNVGNLKIYPSTTDRGAGAGRYNWC